MYKEAVMAKKKDETPETPETVDQKSENQAVQTPPEDQTPMDNAPGAETGTPPEPPETPEPQAPALESLALLADRHRVPTWQQAALCRYMGWEDGKKVSNADYLDALDKIKTRRVGGGRMG